MKNNGADILIADCGLGNLHSVAAALERVAPAAEIRVSAKADDVEKAKKIVLPGDGHFDACAREIRARGLENALRRAAREKPFFGICVGMQILYESSDEGGEKGLGVFKGRIRRLPEGDGRKVPHMGWNRIALRKTHPILRGLGGGTRFYFIHSYYAPPCEASAATAEYGAEMTAAAAAGSLVATQFHPEKSGRRGLLMLANFAARDFGAECAKAGGG